MTNDYVQRVNRAIDHVLQNLADPLHLEDLAKVACFSPFHFHRIFRSLVGEPVRQFVRRVRLDRAVVMLSQRPRRSMTEIALACGFGSSSDFTRTFKQRFGVAPSAFDVVGFRDRQRAAWQDVVGGKEDRLLLDRLPEGSNPDGFVPTIVDLPPRRVAYVRVPDSFRPGVVAAGAERLVAWADERGLGDGQWLGYMWDDPDVVPPEKCRYDVGLVLPAGPAHSWRGEVGCLELPAMRVAQIEVSGPIDLELRALDWLFVSWLPTSGYVPVEQPMFEAWRGRPFAHGVEHFELAVQMPITRASAP